MPASPSSSRPFHQRLLGDWIGLVSMATFCCLWLAQMRSHAAEVSDQFDYQEALRALADGLPEVAAVKWERMLKSGDLSDQDKSQVASRLLDAMVRARMGTQALAAIKAYRPPDEDFWKGQAYTVLGQFRDAEHSFRAYMAHGRAEYLSYARLAMAKAMMAQDRESVARKELREMYEDKDPYIVRYAKLWSSESELVSTPERAPTVLKRFAGSERVDPEVEFIKGCAQLATGDAQAAQSTFYWLLNHKNLESERLDEAAFIRRDEAMAALGRARFSEKQLLDYLDKPGEKHFYEAAFAILRKVMDSPDLDDNDASVRFKEWTADPKDPERHALALYHYADWLAEKGHRREAIPYLEEFLQRYPDHLRASEAMRLAMECHGAAGDDDRVLELANQWREKFSSSAEGTVDFLTGMIRFSRKEYPEAKRLFAAAAKVAINLEQKQHAVYNEAISAFLSGAMSDFEASRVQLQKLAGPVDEGEDVDDPAARLLLDRALHLASKRDSRAEKALQEFLKAYPDSPHAVEADVVMAEYCLLSDPPRPKAAEAALQNARLCKFLPEDWKERVDYTEMWLREATGDIAATAQEAQTFLKQWPRSKRKDEVRMKLAQAYYRSEDYSKAMGQFDLLVEENARSNYAEAARFFAGKASLALMNDSGLDRAIERWSEVADGGGSLAIEARHQQALVKRRQGKTREALAVIDAILTGKPGPQGEQHMALLIEKGELLMLRGKQEGHLQDEAAEIFVGISKDSNASRLWRNRAAVLLAHYYQNSGRTAEALEASTNVVKSTLGLGTGQLTPADYLWLYHAGFFALDLLEERKEWEGAAHLADELAQSGGDRAEEARQRATAIRLEHFLWDK